MCHLGKEKTKGGAPGTHIMYHLGKEKTKGGAPGVADPGREKRARTGHPHPAFGIWDTRTKTGKAEPSA